jgi:hypothetical protein
MNDKLVVFADLKRDWDSSYYPERILLTRGEVSLSLDREEYMHLKNVLAGKEGIAAEQLKEGEYAPEQMTVWSIPEIKE